MTSHSKSSQEFQPNGCGGKGGLIDPPDWIFHKDCNKHDTKYHIGGTEEDRKIADDEFLADMLASVEVFARKPIKWYRKPGQVARIAFLKSQAYLYYRAVRFCGKKFFNYRSEC